MPAIEAFVSDALATIDISPHLRYLLNRKLVRRCTNDFLWASVVISDILANIDTLNEKQLLGLIDGLPVSQKDVYERALGAAEGLQGADTLLLLQTVWAAKRPMTADEFRHSLAFNKAFEYDSIAEWEQSLTGFEKGDKFENYLRKESRGLIEIHQSSEPESHVRFIHGSVSIFLRDPNSVRSSEASPWAERCHLALLRTCFHELDTHPIDPVAFTDYTSENWIYHARDCGDLFDELGELPACLVD